MMPVAPFLQVSQRQLNQMDDGKEDNLRDGDVSPPGGDQSICATRDDCCHIACE